MPGSWQSTMARTALAFIRMAASTPSGTMPRESVLPRAKAPSVPAPPSSLGNRRRPVSVNCWTWAGICPRVSLTGWTSTSASNGAAQLWYLRQDFAEGTADAGFLPTVNTIYNTHQGFPEESAAISDLLGHPEGLQNLRDELEQFVTAYGENGNCCGSISTGPQKLLEQLSDLQRNRCTLPPPKGTTPSGDFSSPGTRLTIFCVVENAAPITGWPCILSTATTQSARNGRIS